MAILRSRHASFVSRIEGLAKSEIRAVTTGKNRIMIHGPKADGTYVVEFKTAAGAVLAISIPGSEAAVPAFSGADAQWVVRAECERFRRLNHTATTLRLSGGSLWLQKHARHVAAQRYRKVFGVLQLRPPAHIPVARWQQCVDDGKRFLAKWGEQAQALNWSSADLFGLHQPPDRPHPSYSRLSRYDATGLCWLLQGRDVIALTAEGAVIRTATGAILTYYRHGRPAYGPIGDWVLDIDPRWGGI
jgi:hypothetical protein